MLDVCVYCLRWLALNLWQRAAYNVGIASWHLPHAHPHPHLWPLLLSFVQFNSHGLNFYCVHEPQRGGQQTKQVLFLTCNCILKNKTVEGLELNKYNGNTTSQNLVIKVVCEFVSVICHLSKSEAIKSYQLNGFKCISNIEVSKVPWWTSGTSNVIIHFLFNFLGFLLASLNNLSKSLRPTSNSHLKLQRSRFLVLTRICSSAKITENFILKREQRMTCQLQQSVLNNCFHFCTVFMGVLIHLLYLLRNIIPKD